MALLRELNDKAPFITTPIAQLPGEKILETMESGKSLGEELLAEVACPVCGHVHDHDHDHHHDDHDHDHDHHGHEEHGHDDHDHHDHEHDHHDTIMTTMITITENAAAAMTITITIMKAIITRMKCSQAGAGRQSGLLTKKESKPF